MAVEIVVPTIGESVVEATVSRWLKEEGDTVAAGEAVVELETDKVDLEVGAEKDGVLAEIKAKAGDDVKVGDTLGLIDPGDGTKDAEDAEDAENGEDAEDAEADEQEEAGDGEDAEGAEKAAGEEDAEEAEDEEDDEEEGVRSTPLARQVATEHDVDLGAVEASGRVTRADVERHVGPQRPEERRPLGRRRRTIARRLVEVQRTAVPVTTFNEVDMTSVLEVRDRHRNDLEERYGARMGITSFFVKAVLGALKDFPVLNAEIREDEMVLKRYYDIGIAAATDKGLVVPVLRDADRLSFAEIEVRIKEFAAKAKEDRFTLDDLRGGTFTITNGGVFGSLMSTPFLNPPQVGILGLHRIQERAVVRDRQPIVRPMMYVALSYDHRLVDGREAVRFLGRIKELVEDAEALFLES